MKIQQNTLSYKQTIEFGNRLGKHLIPGDIICLNGTLGSGKTTFTQGIAEGWGARTKATSPTFTLINVHDHHQSDIHLAHIDAYRLRDESDALSTGIEDILGDEDKYIVIIEWAERIPSLIPEDVVQVNILVIGPDSRTFTLSGSELRLSRLLK